MAKVLITRAEPAANQTAEFILKSGHQPIVMPIFKISDTGKTIPEKQYNGIIFTSKNAVAILQTRNWQYQDMNIPAFCVGEKTKKAAMELGFTNTITANGGGAELTKLMDDEAYNGKTFLYPSTPDKSFDMAGRLEPFGINVETVDIYQAITITPSKEGFTSAITEAAGHYIFTYSALSSGHLKNLLEKFHVTSSLKQITLIGISKQAIKPLEHFDWKSIAISRTPNEADMLKQIN